MLRACRFNLCPLLITHPVGLEFKLSTFDHLGNQRNNAANLASANFGDLFEGVPLLKQLNGFFRGRQLLFRRFPGASAFSELTDRFQNERTVEFRLAFAESIYAA